MAGRPPWWWAVLRPAALALLLLGGLAALRTTNPAGWGPVVVLTALFAGAMGGRLARSLGLPAVFGWLTLGVVLGPSLHRLAARMVPAWPFPDGLLGPAELAGAQGLIDLCATVAAVWVGRMLDPRELRGGARAIVATVVGYGLVIGTLTVGVGALLLGRPDDAGAVSDWLATPAHVATFTVGLLATSALLTAAMVHDDRADGPVTRSVLWVAVLGEVGALVGLVGWLTVSGTQGTPRLADPGGFGDLTFAISTGLVGGALLAGLVRVAEGARGPLMVLGAAVTAFLAAQAGLPPVLSGLVVGATVSWLAPADLSETLHAAAGVAFVVVFTAAGALVPLRPLLDVAPVALGLAAVRGIFLFGAAIGLGRLLRADSQIVRYAWTGLCASAVPVAGLLPWRSLVDGGPPDAVTSALWGLAVVDGLGAAVAVHLGLRFAAETPATRDAREAARLLAPDSGWAAVEALEAGREKQVLTLLAEDLQALVRDVRLDAERTWASEASTFHALLRKDLLRHHRRVTALMQADPNDAAGLRSAALELAERWRSFTLDHAGRMNRHPWTPDDLIEALDRLAQQVPARLELPPSERPREAQQAFRVFTAWLVGAAARDDLPYRDLVRHHLAGRTPERLEAVASVMVNAELALADDARALFQRILDGYGSDPARLDPDRLLRVKAALLEDAEVARASATAEVDTLKARLTSVLGRALRDVVVDLGRLRSGDLPPGVLSAPNTSLAREEAEAALRPRYDVARDTAKQRFASLAVELELVALELEMQQALAEQGQHLARLVRGRGTTQFGRVSDALDELLVETETVLADEEADGDAIAEALRAAASDVSSVVVDAAATAEDLRAHLASDEALEPLHDALVHAGAHLADRHVVPVGRTVEGGWVFPDATATADVPFREVVVGHVETAVTRDLVSLTDEYVGALAEGVAALEAVDRAVGFTVELAVAEAMTDGPVTPEGRDAVREIVSEGLARDRAALATLQDDAAGWYDTLLDRIQAAVLGDLQEIRDRLSDGRFSELAAEVSSNLAAEARADAVSLARRLDDALHAWIGESGLARLREQLGLPEPEAHALTPERFAHPAHRTDVPASYARLFSAQAMEAGELVGGRTVQADRVREALEDVGGTRLRTVAVVGPHGAGQPAIVRAALRAMRVRSVVRHAPTDPISPREVDSWFERGATKQVHVVSNLHHLYTFRPGGFEPLRRFVAGVLADEGRNAWVVDADASVWRHAGTVAPVERAFPTVIPIEPLDEERLTHAMLARHRMSGFELEVGTPVEPGSLDRRQRAWFRDFHAACGGVAADAMSLWLACIDEVDEDGRRVVMGSVPEVPVRAMDALTDRSALALRTAVAQGWIDAPTWSRLTRMPTLDARAHLSHLVHWGLLEPDGDRWRVPDHLHRALAELERRRGWS